MIAFHVKTKIWYSFYKVEMGIKHIKKFKSFLYLYFPKCSLIGDKKNTI